MPVEIHPYKAFLPINAKYLLLGSFPGKATPENNWFYGSKRNQFWRILEEVYKTKLATIEEKKKLLENLNLAITDIILSCERKLNNNLDSNLTNIEFNIATINKIVEKHKIVKIYFSSRFVENHFKAKFRNLINKYPDIKLITLPSPSPRYARLTIEEKIKRYEELLPSV